MVLAAAIASFSLWLNQQSHDRISSQSIPIATVSLDLTRSAQRIVDVVPQLVAADTADAQSALTADLREEIDLLNGLLEEIGLILEVGSWALQRAAQDHARWREAGLDAPRVAVNVSPVQLRRPDFVSVVQAAIGADPEGGPIDLEITEGLVMEDVEDSIEKLDGLRQAGIRIAIDDFGTGYSSLRYLARLPVHTLKVDQTFIASMLGDPNAMTVVSTIISLAHLLGLRVVAEGVETQPQAQALRGLRCDELQGYLIQRPVPAEEMLHLLREWRPGRLW